MGRGIWKDELWTQRDFTTMGIMLAPYSSQLKDTHLMASNHAVVNLPNHGRGAYPENQCLALDGRGKNQMARSGSLDGDEHLGSLCWLVGKTSNPSEANMVLDSMTLEQQNKVNPPGLKQRKVQTLKWGPPEMLAIPIPANKQALAKHTKLIMYLPDPQKKDKK